MSQIPTKMSLIGAARKLYASIERDRACGFAALRHVMRFEAMGAAGEDLVVAGDVFQRAQLLDTMIDARGWLDAPSRAALNVECTVLVDRRRLTGIGGWSYFPDFPLLAPDADDLAEMIRVLARLGKNDLIRAHCIVPLTVLFHDCAHGDGAFETWIIPCHNRSPEQAAQAWAAAALWGTGADLAVVANVSDAVQTAAAALDPPAIAAAARARRYVVDRVARGELDSAWYFGTLYPAFAAARMLAADAADAVDEIEARAAIEASLTACQQSDGGWGAGRSSDALSTALALLALLHVNRHCAAIDSAIVTLLSMVEEDRCVASPFIKMDTGRTLGIVGRVESYGSVPNTENFVLKAILTTLSRRFSP